MHMMGEGPVSVLKLLAARAVDKQGNKLLDGPLHQLESIVFGEVDLLSPGAFKVAVLGFMEQRNALLKELQSLGQAGPSRRILEFLEVLGCQIAQQKQGLGKVLESSSSPGMSLVSRSVPRHSNSQLAACIILLAPAAPSI